MASKKGATIVAGQLPSAPYELIEPEAPAEELYVDGFVGQTVSSGVIKTNLYTLAGLKQDGDAVVEQRRVRLRLVMPTANFIEMCAATLGTLRSHESDLREAFDNTRDATMRNLTPPAPPVKKRSG